ncbi:Long-chain-fatty-acid--CoA ligase [subsurface metagenome]
MPTMVTTLVNYPDLAKYDLSSLKQMRIGGAPMSAALFKAVEEKIGCEVYSGYGLTETMPLLTSSRSKDYLSGLTGEERVEKLRRTGFADLLVDVRVVNEKGEDVKPDGKEIGEVIVRGNNIINEYWKLPEETERTIVNGWFHTGDVANMDEDGYIQIVDRTKDIIISGGENISSFEIENAIYSHPVVLECAVVAAPHEIWGETVAALVVLKEGESLTKEELIAHCRTQLARFKVPKIVDFMSSLPKGGTGKILKRELRERFWKGHDRRVA